MTRAMSHKEMVIDYPAHEENVKTQSLKLLCRVEKYCQSGKIYSLVIVQYRS